MEQVWTPNSHGLRWENTRERVVKFAVLEDVMPHSLVDCQHLTSKRYCISKSALLVIRIFIVLAAETTKFTRTSLQSEHTEPRLNMASCYLSRPLLLMVLL
jgi:hypothetical protein